MSTQQITDKELGERAHNAMKNNEYDIAINNVRRMSHQAIGTKMELLIIEHEQAHLKELRGK